MRRFSAAYLRDTRRGMWDDRSALADLQLSSHDRILDVGCGTGELTRVLREESPGTVVGTDADRDLLDHLDGPGVQGDALRLPYDDDTFDLVVSQALLINLPDPAAAIREFSRVSRALVAAIEPDNSRVAIESTVTEESSLAERARNTYIQGVETDVTLGSTLESRFRAAGLEDVAATPHTLRRSVSAPYSESDVESAKRKVRGTRIDEQRRTLLAGGLTHDEVDALKDDWQEMGRSVVQQMADGVYERTGTVPFYVTVGRVA